MEMNWDFGVFKGMYRRQIQENAYAIADVAMDAKEAVDYEHQTRSLSFFITLAQQTFPRLSEDHAHKLYIAMRVCKTRREAVDKLLTAVPEVYVQDQADKGVIVRRRRSVHAYNNSRFDRGNVHCI